MAMAANRRAGRTREELDVPVGSFADIAFLLIIFFILVTSLSQIRGFQSELPAAQQAETQPEQTPTIALHRDRILFNDRELALDDLRAALGRLGLADRTGEDKVVLIEASDGVVYQTYFEVMAAIGQAGGVVGIVQEQDGATP